MRVVKKVSMAEFLKKFDETCHDAIRNAIKAMKATGLVALQCEVMDSSRLGMLTALCYGPNCTYKTLEDVIKTSEPAGIYTTGLPSSAAFPKFYTEEV